MKSHDTILYYAKSYGAHIYNRQYTAYSEKYVRERFTYTDDEGRRYRTRKRPSGEIHRQYLDESPGVPLSSVWSDITQLYAYHLVKRKQEEIGYPTQKPEALLERIINTSSNEGDVVADFFVGGGTTAAVAQRLGRRFIACDQSRVAVAVTAERLKYQSATRGMDDAPLPDFTVEQWGIYEAERLSAMPAADFRDFVLRAYGRTRDARDYDGPHIHGWRNQFPIWVGAPVLESQATADDVRDFANAIRQTAQYQQNNLRDGIMLAWGFRADARAAAEQLRELEQIDVNFVRLAQVNIDGPDFREHIVGRSTDKADYSEFLTFIQPPVVNVGYRILGGGSVTFDAGDTAVINAGAEIINVQWDFNYNGLRFEAAPGYSFRREGKGKNRKPAMRITHKFAGAGRYNVACRVQDSQGGEGLWQGTIEVR